MFRTKAIELDGYGWRVECLDMAEGCVMTSLEFIGIKNEDFPHFDDTWDSVDYLYDTLLPMLKRLVVDPEGRSALTYEDGVEFSPKSLERFGTEEGKIMELIEALELAKHEGWK